MKTIIIKSLRLLNFKGIREIKIDFNADSTFIHGRNGSGKTTLFDAFTWVLFGKDSLGREDFDLKTLDADGKIIYHLPHEVEAVINVDGEDITLLRRVVEKFPKRNGVPTFTGNVTERFVNDVPCNEKEYNAKIAEFCDEQTFRKITSPTYFVSQKPDKQKEDLFRMAGTITDADIIGDNPDFIRLAELRGNKTLDEYKRELAAKHTKIKKNIEDIPSRIDEKKRDIAKYTDDWAAIESEIKSETAKRDDVDRQLTEINAESQRIIAANNAIAADIAKLRTQQSQYRDEMTQTIYAEYYAAKSERKNIETEIETENSHIIRLTKLIATDRAALADLETRKTRMVKEYHALNKRAAEIKAETLQFDDSDFVCPTCHRSFDLEQIDSKQSEMTKHFDDEKRRRLAATETEIESNLQRGRALKKEINDTNANIAASEKSIKEHRDKIATLEIALNEIEMPTEPDVNAILANDVKFKEFDTQIAELSAKQNTPESGAAANRDELKIRRDEHNRNLDVLKQRLNNRSKVNDANERIAELEKEYRTNNDEMTEIEGIFSIIDEFSKTKSVAIDNRINGMFQLVKFRWLKYMINGNEKETCEATINGVPYQSLNTAGRLAAGIDIINAICRFEGVTAPIFIDNRESITNIPDVDSQVVNLVVSTDETLTIK